MTADDALPPTIVLFDGVCGLCDALVRFLVRVDKKRALRFAPLQGSTARVLRQTHPELPTEVETMALVDHGRVYLRSRAAFGVLGHLGLPWKLCAILRVLPAPLTDLGYRLIARVRYRLFDKLDQCRVPEASERELFLP